MDSKERNDPEETQASDTVNPETQRSSQSEDPTFVEEFSILETLGRGGFGTVYLAFDTTLQREVAVKIPHRRLVGKKKTAGTYLREARAIASLDHPNIIPVYRASSTAEIPCYIVTKRIRGSHLGQWRQRRRPSFSKVADILASVADALAYAHKNGVVHRDIKPGNILVDDEDHAYVADFGLALRDADPKGGASYVGTPTYMSPEQARGEGHRVDGRSDIFSLGVVLYELLTGSRPFRAEHTSELYELILYADPVHPCQSNADVPAELARICLKSMSKAVSDRYSSAELLAADLRAACPSDASSVLPESSDSRTRSSSGNTKPIDDDSSVPAPPTVVPKGLRAFSLHDAEFYPQLLPGPHDRDGVPEIIRFWLSKLNPRGSEQPLTVGLIYGPSGCGKTSLVRAGIVPRMSPNVDTIYIQATAANTESDLVKQIVSHIGPDQGDVEDDIGIQDAFAMLRRSRRKRTVVFIDQFEQWLFAHPECLREPLTNALRQCDGEYLQCVLMVRDDFWMGVTRLMQVLDLPIAENINVTAVDLFDARHARSVLARFGAAYGKLPDSIEMLSPAQTRFLDAAVDYLVTDGRVICVQLALLTEMLKNRSWESTAGVFDDGGAGLGMRFFEETFDSDATPRRIRIHAEGTLRVLRALLPDLGSPIKGSMRSEQELFDESGYGERTHFRQLIAILDRELHLITPTDRSDDASLSGDSSSSEKMSTGYQLTHDFLIAPIRQWIEYHNRTSKHGKAKLRLDEFTELYRRHPRAQSLPTISEYVAIRRRLAPATFNDSQSRMMNAAMRRHRQTVLVALLAFGVLAAVGFAINRNIRTQSAAIANQAAFDRLLVAKMTDAIGLSADLRSSPYAVQAAEAVLDTVVASEDTAAVSRQVRAAMLIANENPKAVSLLSSYVLSGPEDDVVQLMMGLDVPMGAAGHEVWETVDASRTRHIRAACLMARDPQYANLLRRDSDSTRLVKLLLEENPLWIRGWSQALEPVSDALVPRLSTFLKDESRSEESLNGVNLIAEYASNDTAVLASLVPAAFPNELNVLTNAIAALGSEGVNQMQREWQLNSEPMAQPLDGSQPWGSPWWCVGPRKTLSLGQVQPLNEELTQRLRSFESVVETRAILSHKLPMNEFERVSDSVCDSGYRVGHVAPYQIDSDRMLMVLWIRDGIESRIAIDVAADELWELNDEHLQTGFLPDSISAYHDPEDGSLKFTSVWIDVPDDSGLLDADMYVDVHESDHQSVGWQPLGDRGLWLNRSAITVAKADGSDYLSSVRWRTESDMGSHDDWGMELDKFESIQRNNRSSALLIGRLKSHSQNTEDSERRKVPIWWHHAPVESENIDYQSRRDHLRSAQRLFASGHFPVSIDVTNVGDDPTPLFQSTWWRDAGNVMTDVRQSNRLRNIAFSLYLLGDETRLTAALQSGQSPSLRGATIAGFRRFRLRPDWLVEKLSDADENLALRRSCGMALALYQPGDASESTREQVAAVLPSLYDSGSDPGLRSAIEAIMTRWGLLLEFDQNGYASNELRSIVGDRLVILRPENPIWLGSTQREPGRDAQKEPMTPVTIEQPFAIASREVTIAQYREFRPDHGYAKDYASTEDCPIIDVNWFDAARYCRWLSEKEGIAESEMCYPPIDQIKPGMRVPNNFLQRTGYRLPTEAEWEFACRGGSASSRWFGFDPDRLDEHAWTARNSGYRLHPVATLLPNDYGLFDMLGNAMDYCHTRYASYPRLREQPMVDPGKDCLVIAERELMCNRGGAVLYQPLDARAAQRDYHGASSARVYLTFRIARTVPDGKK